MDSNILKVKHQPSTSNWALTWNAIFLAAASGVLLFLSFPKYGSGYLIWIALIPLFWAVRETTSIRQGLLLGFITGMVFHIGLIYWIAYVIVNYGHLPIYLGILIMLLLACYLGLYVAVFTAGVVFFRRRIALYFTAPVLWVCLEYGKSYLLTGFPWENLAYSQYLHGNLIQLADWTGIYGITFAIVLANALWADCFAERDRKRLLLTEGLAVIALIAAMVGYGHFRILDLENDLRGAAGFPVTLVQGNIDQSVKWDPRYQEETLEIYRFLTLREKAGEGSSGRKRRRRSISSSWGRCGKGWSAWPEPQAGSCFSAVQAMRRRTAGSGTGTARFSSGRTASRRVGMTRFIWFPMESMCRCGRFFLSSASWWPGWGISRRERVSIRWSERGKNWGC